MSGGSGGGVDGLVSVTVSEGRGLSAGLFGKKDPFVIGSIGAQKFHTSAVHNGGKNPKWEQTFSLVIPPSGADAAADAPPVPNLEISVYDKDHLTPDDLMGRGTLDLSCLHLIRTIEADVPIYKRKKAAGTVKVAVQLHLLPGGPGGPMSAGAGAGAPPGPGAGPAPLGPNHPYLPHMHQPQQMHQPPQAHHQQPHYQAPPPHYPSQQLHQAQMSQPQMPQHRTGFTSSPGFPGAGDGAGPAPAAGDQALPSSAGMDGSGYPIPGYDANPYHQ